MDIKVGDQVQVKGETLEVFGVSQGNAGITLQLRGERKEPKAVVASAWWDSVVVEASTSAEAAIGGIGQGQFEAIICPKKQWDEMHQLAARIDRNFVDTGYGNTSAAVQKLRAMFWLEVE